MNNKQVNKKINVFIHMIASSIGKEIETKEGAINFTEKE